MIDKKNRKQTSDVSVIILSWNTRELLRQCINSVLESEIGDWRVEIIVVDNGSDDGSGEMVKKFKISNLKFKIELIENKENLGFSKGNNLGIKEAKGELVLLLNSDTLIKDQTINRLKNYFDKNKKATVVSPLILNKDGSVQFDPVYLKLPSIKTAIFYYNPLFRKVIFKLPFLKNLIFCQVKENKEHSIEQFSGAAIMFRRDVFKRAGLFDENFPFYFEDSDLSMRLLKLGEKILVYPLAKVIHLKSASMKKQVETKDQFFYFQRNFSSLLLFCQKHYSKLKTIIIKYLLILNWIFTSILYFPLSCAIPDFKKKISVNFRLVRFFLVAKTEGYSKWL